MNIDSIRLLPHRQSRLIGDRVSCGLTPAFGMSERIEVAQERPSAKRLDRSQPASRLDAAQQSYLQFLDRSKTSAP
jgi:hypothetical protein